MFGLLLSYRNRCNSVEDPGSFEQIVSLTLSKLHSNSVRVMHHSLIEKILKPITIFLFQPTCICKHALRLVVYIDA